MGGVKPGTQISGTIMTNCRDALVSRQGVSDIKTPYNYSIRAYIKGGKLKLTSASSVIKWYRLGKDMKLWRDVLEESKRKYKKSIRESPITLPAVDTVRDEFLCVGLGSKQSTGKHILFLDLDERDVSKSEKIARKLINLHGVSDCYIAKSSPGNHHLICFDMLDFSLVQKIAKQHAHRQWAKFRGKSNDFVLRVSPKLKLREFSGVRRLVPVEGTQPTLVSIVKSPFNNYSKSNSLRRVFQNLWGQKIHKDKHFTDSSKFRFHIYRVRLLPKGKEVERIGDKGTA